MKTYIITFANGRRVSVESHDAALRKVKSEMSMTSPRATLVAKKDADGFDVVRFFRSAGDSGDDMVYVAECAASGA